MELGKESEFKMTETMPTMEERVCDNAEVLRMDHDIFTSYN